MHAQLTQQQAITEVCFWVGHHLGKQVKLVRPYDVYGDGSVIEQPGPIGVLQGLEAHSKDGARALVWFEDEGDMKDIPFRSLGLV